MTASYNLSLLGSNYNQGGSGAVARTTASKLQESVSVKDFGAVGDGTTDDTAAIQAAIAACSIGGTVLFPPGQFKLTSAITINKPINIVGLGGGSAYNDSGSYVIQSNVSANAFTLVATLANFAFSQYGIVGVNFRDICIEGASASTPSLNGIGVNTLVNGGVFQIRENSLTNVTIKYFKVGCQFTGIAYLNKFFNCQFYRNIIGFQTLQGSSGTAGGQTRFFGCTFDLLPTLTAINTGVCLSWFTDTRGGDLTIVGCTFADAYQGIVCNDTTQLVVQGCHFENLNAANSFTGSTAGSGAGIYIPTPSSAVNPINGTCKNIIGNNFNANDQSIWIENKSSGLGAGGTSGYYPALIDGNTSQDTVFLNITSNAGVLNFFGQEFQLGRSNCNGATAVPITSAQITGLFQAVNDGRKIRFTRKYAISNTYASGSAIDILPNGLIIYSVRIYLTVNCSGFSQLTLGDLGNASRYANFNGQSQALNTWVNYAPTTPPFAVTAGSTDKLNLIGSGGMLGAVGVIEVDGYLS